MIEGKNVFVGLSGGVDSAVSAALLKEQGYHVTGVFIKVWHPDFLPCKWKDERRDAMRVAVKLGIPFLFLDLEEEYKKGVADQMIEEYKKGRTPNPDVLCNREIKFGAFWREAKKRGADYIATGHYARVITSDIARKNALSLPAGNAHSTPAAAVRDVFSSQNHLLTGLDQNKDQSYFLWTLTQEDLEHVLFPIGNLEKSEVRRLAKKFKIPVAEKKDSQGVCFIGEITLEDFLSHFIDTKQGDVLNTNEEVIGRHNGALFYTLGQRHGFEIIKKGPRSGAFYIVSKDMKKNTLTVSNDEKEILERSPKLIRVTSANLLGEIETSGVSARIRYRQKNVPVEVKKDEGTLIVKFREPERGLSLGQSIVFYKDDLVLGGGIMNEVLA